MGELDPYRDDALGEGYWQREADERLKEVMEMRFRMEAAERERDEVRRRAERVERLSEARLLVLKQYVAHHSSCGECYRVWVDVWVTDPGVVPLTGDQSTP